MFNIFALFGFSRKSATKIGALKIAFYTDAAVHGSHGRIRVSHRREGLTEQVVNFALEGVSTAPEVTPSLVEHIWKEAYAQGYVPHSFVGFLEDNTSQATQQFSQAALAAVGLTDDTHPVALAPAATVGLVTQAAVPTTVAPTPPAIRHHQRIIPRQSAGALAASVAPQTGLTGFAVAADAPVLAPEMLTGGLVAISPDDATLLAAAGKPLVLAAVVPPLGSPAAATTLAGDPQFAALNNA